MLVAGGSPHLAIEFRVKDGTISTIDEWSTETTDQVADVDRTVYTLSNDPTALGQLVTALTRAAPPGASLAFIGTWVLEDVRSMTNQEILGALAKSALTASERHAILSGFDMRSMPNAHE
jgi:hypothetical protein